MANNDDEFAIARNSMNQRFVNVLLRMAEEYALNDPQDDRLRTLGIAIPNVRDRHNQIRDADDAQRIPGIGPVFAAVMFNQHEDVTNVANVVLPVVPNAIPPQNAPRQHAVAVPNVQQGRGHRGRAGRLPRRHQERAGGRPRQRRAYTPEEREAIVQGIRRFGKSLSATKRMRRAHPVLSRRTPLQLFDHIRQSTNNQYQEAYVYYISHN